MTVDGEGGQTEIDMIWDFTVIMALRLGIKDKPAEIQREIRKVF